MFEFSMILTINKPMRVTKHTATTIDNIITNCTLNCDFKSAIVKTDLSDHLPIIFINKGCFRSVLTAVYRFWAHLIWAPKLGKPGKKSFFESKHRYFL